MILYLDELYKYSIESENSVVSIYHVLSLLCEDEWYVSKVKSMDYETEITFVVPPKTKEVIEWLSDYNGMVFISDATMPFRNLNEVFQSKLKEFHLGDPNKTSETQLVICDSQNISPTRIFVNSERLERYVKEIIDAFGKESFMVALSNKRTHKYFKKRFPDIPEDNITYYRSSKTIGVANNLRAMLVVSNPYTPRNAFDWMSINLFGDNSKGIKIWQANAYSTFFQTISRVKDPEGLTHSVVWAYGIRHSMARNLLARAEGQPQIVEVPQFKNIHNGHVIIAEHWYKYGRVLGTNEYKVLILHKNNFSIKEITRRLKLPKRFVQVTILNNE